MNSATNTFTSALSFGDRKRGHLVQAKKWFVGALLVLGANQQGTAIASEPINVASEKQLFIDHRFIEESKNVSLVLNRPRPTLEKLIVVDRPWESFSIGDYLSVIQEGDRIHMWYEVSAREGNKWQTFVAYAYSTDGGSTWLKPNLGIIDFHGSKDNNLVTKDTAGIHVFRNRPEAPLAEKFCMFVQTPDANDGPNQAFVSPDGWHWSSYGTRPFLDTSINQQLTLDSQNVIFWDTRIKRYVAYPRFNLKTKIGRTGVTRSFGYASSDSFGKFPKFEIVLKPDEMDSIDMDWYTTAAIQYPYAADAYFMFPAAYHHFPNPPVGKYRNDGPIDIQFSASRDGINWSRPDRQPILRLGETGAWDGGSMYVGYGLSRKGSDLSIYYTVHDVTHGAYVKNNVLAGVITRATYRLDGFVSVDAAYQGGEFTTPFVIFDGDHLEVNFDGSAGGWLIIELMDADGRVIPGFAAADADKLLGNGVAKTISWSGRSNISQFIGKPIKIRFIMLDAKLYAFQFTSAAH